MDTNRNTGNSDWLLGSIFSTITVAKYLERLPARSGNLTSWIYSKLNRLKLWATSSNWSGFEKEGWTWNLREVPFNLTYNCVWDYRYRWVSQQVSSQGNSDSPPARDCSSVSAPTGWENLDKHQMMKTLKIHELQTSWESKPYNQTNRAEGTRRWVWLTSCGESQSALYDQVAAGRTQSTPARTMSQAASSDSQQPSKQWLRPLAASCPQTACPGVTALPRDSYTADEGWAPVPATPQWASHHPPPSFRGDMWLYYLLLLSLSHPLLPLMAHRFLLS